MVSASPMIPNRPTLEKGLYKLLEDVSSRLSFNFDHPLSEDELQVGAKTLLTYLTYYTTRNNVRRANTPILAANLMLDNMRTYNPDEEKISDNGKRVKGDKEWYHLVLSETTVSGGLPQILAEGGLVKEKKDLLDAFIATLAAQNVEWEEREKEEAARKQSRNRDSAEKDEAELAREEIEKMENAKGGRKKAVGRKARNKVKLSDLMDEDDM